MARTLLVIDNDESLVDLESLYFGEQGFTVLTALDGDIGVRLALAHEPHVIICDLIMGKMHGFEVLQTLRAHHELRNTVIIMTSAKAYKADIERARHLGATDYVVKPFRTDELMALIEGHLAALHR